MKVTNLIPILKFSKFKKNHSNYVHCYNGKRAMGDIPFDCIKHTRYVTTWKRERDALIDEEVIINDIRLIGQVKLLEIMHFYPFGLPTHVVVYHVNDILVAYYTYCELAKNLFKVAWETTQSSLPCVSFEYSQL